MHAAVLLGVPVVAIASTFALGILRRRRAERRASTAEALALAARRGLPLDAPLESAAAGASPRRALALRAVVADLRAGQTLAASLRVNLRREFPRAVTASIQAGERASRLPEALEAVAAEAGRDLSRGHRMALAAFYPALLFLGVAALNLLVLERRIGFIDGSWLTGESAVAHVAWPVVAVRYALFGGALAVAGLVVIRRLLRPVSGADTARFLRTTALLLHAGRPVHEAFAVAATSAGSRRLANAASRASARVLAGDPVASLWAALPIARQARERLASASTQGLPSLLEEVADGCDARDRRIADRWIRWSVPVATAAAGLLVAIDYAALASAWANVQQATRPW